MSFVLVNLFFVGMAVIAAGLLFGWGALMRIFGLEPDQYPSVLMLGIVACIVATYFISKYAHAWIARRLR